METATRKAGSYLHKTYSTTINLFVVHPLEIAEVIDDLITAGIAELTTQAAATNINRLVTLSTLAPTPGRLTELSTTHSITHLDGARYQVTVTLTACIA
jgi:hypothetical protein